MSSVLNPPRTDWLATAPALWQALATEHGTPFYLFDADVVRARISAVRAACGGHAGVYFAVKANPNLGLLKAVHGVADGLDISSGGELSQALLAGHAPEAMSFAGPAKTDAEIEAAVRAGVGAISAESLREIDACAAAAKRLNRPANVLLRVNPLLAAKPYGLKMGGRAVQFGIDEDDLPAALAGVRLHGAALRLRGLHAYVGSQCFDVAGAVEATANALRIADSLRQHAGVALDKINLGGGFGVAQAEAHRELDLSAFGAAVTPVLAAERRRHPDCALFFELGRFLLADAGVYVVRVVDVKTSRGKTFATCDGGLNHQLSAAGTFGAALRSFFPLRNLSRPQAPTAVLNLAGPSCNPTDLLGVDASLPLPMPGDLIGVGLSGAYGLTASPLLFLGRDTPAELVRSVGQISVGRRSRPMTDFN